MKNKIGFRRQKNVDICRQNCPHYLNISISIFYMYISPTPLDFCQHVIYSHAHICGLTCYSCRWLTWFHYKCKTSLSLSYRGLLPQFLTSPSLFLCTAISSAVPDTRASYIRLLDLEFGKYKLAENKSGGIDINVCPLSPLPPFRSPPSR